MDKDRRIEELLEIINNNEKYRGCVFWGPGIYFVVGDGCLWEISDDAGCSPRGSWFPDIVSGPTKEENECLEKMMDELGFDENFFYDMLEESCGDFDDEYALEYFEENDDEDSAKIYRKMKAKVESGKTPFENIDDFVMAVGKYGLDSDGLYYEWEGMYIDLYGNIQETGDERGTYEDLDDDIWIKILENIDDHIVTA